jgi:hypothetical protein
MTQSTEGSELRTDLAAAGNTASYHRPTPRHVRSASRVSTGSGASLASLRSERRSDDTASRPGSTGALDDSGRLLCLNARALPLADLSGFEQKLAQACCRGPERRVGMCVCLCECRAQRKATPSEVSC